MASCSPRPARRELALSERAADPAKRRGLGHDHDHALQARGDRSLNPAAHPGGGASVIVRAAPIARRAAWPTAERPPR